MREPAVRGRRSAADSAQGTPDLQLKFGSGHSHRNVVDRAQVTREIAGDCLRDAVGGACGLEVKPMFSVATAKVATSSSLSASARTQREDGRPRQQ
jgi:hypothetical protein